MRRWLTWFVRRPQSIAGNGERIFWNGELDAVLDTIGRAVGHPYPLPPGEYVLPRRFRPCPSCGDTERVQYRVVGMPPAPPRVLDESRVRDEGCTVDEVELGGDWYCPAGDAFYHHVQPRLWTVGYAGVVAGERNPSDSCDGLTTEELGQIYRDIVVGRPTRVVLDTDAKRRTSLRAQQAVAEIHARGHMVEIPDRAANTSVVSDTPGGSCSGRFFGQPGRSSRNEASGDECRSPAGSPCLDTRPRTGAARHRASDGRRVVRADTVGLGGIR